MTKPTSIHPELLNWLEGLKWPDTLPLGEDGDLATNLLSHDTDSVTKALWDVWTWEDCPWGETTRLLGYQRVGDTLYRMPVGYRLVEDRDDARRGHPDQDDPWYFWEASDGSPSDGASRSPVEAQADAWGHAEQTERWKTTHQVDYPEGREVGPGESVSVPTRDALDCPDPDDEEVVLRLAGAIDSLAYQRVKDCHGGCEDEGLELLASLRAFLRRARGGE